MESGPKWIQDESDLQQQSLKEQLDNLETGWNDVHILWENRKKMLIQALNHQVKKTANKKTLKTDESTNEKAFFLFAVLSQRIEITPRFSSEKFLNKMTCISEMFYAQKDV